MKALFVIVAVGIGALLSTGAYAEAPAGAIAQCKDGTYFTGTSHKGACKGHKGVKEWLDKDKSVASTPAAAPATATDAKSTKSKSARTTTETATAMAPAPAGAIARCKDGTYFTGTSHKGACKGHKGVKEWLDKDKPAATTGAPPAAAPTPVPAAPARTPATPMTPAPSTATTPHALPTPASQITQKPGGGPGQVWVNSGSKVYHCPGDEWYGKTKEGSYMTEAAAKAAGNHASHGKECTSK